MRSPRFWSPKKRSTAIILRKEGYTYEQIAEKIGGGVGKSAVRKVCVKFLNFKTIDDLPRCHKKRVTSRQDDSIIVRKSLKNRRLSSKDISADMAEAGVKVSARTVRRRLCSAGLKARIPRKKPFLNTAQRMKRVKWCKDHQYWTEDDWGKVLFSDESRISIFGSDGVCYVRRRVHEEYLPECMLPTMKHPVAVMIWACMGANGVGRVQVMKGIVNARVYIDEILSRKVRQSAIDVFGQGQDFIFQQDGAPCHTAKVCKDWFKENGVKLLEWPGNSPDLNPIENLWARLKKLVSQRRPSNKQELIEAIIHCWNHVITVEELQQLVNSMPRRCKAVIAAKGYPTKY
jgi:transposase